MRRRRIRRNTRLTKSDIAPMIIIALIIAVIIFLGITLFKYRDVLKNYVFNNKTRSVSEIDETQLPYTIETKYIGGIGYPQVYEIPFKKSDIYKMNKQLWIDHPDRPKEIVDVARSFMTYTFNVNYKDVMNSSEYSDKMLSYMDKYWMYEEGNEEANDGIFYFCDEYVKMWADRVVDHEIIMEGEFKTDTSLVYVNGLYYVRGILEYTVYSSTDEEILPTDGKKAVMLEVGLHLKTDDNGYEVVYVDPVTLPEGMVLEVNK